MDKNNGKLADIARQLGKKTTDCKQGAKGSTFTVGTVHIAKVVVVNHPKPRQRRSRNKGRAT